MSYSAVLPLNCFLIKRSHSITKTNLTYCFKFNYISVVLLNKIKYKNENQKEPKESRTPRNKEKILENFSKNLLIYLNCVMSSISLQIRINIITLRWVYAKELL